jgi:hypothetical protein
VNFYQLVQYLKYRWRAKSRHGVHSPYVYRFVEQVLRNASSLRDNMDAFFGSDNVVYTTITETENLVKNNKRKERVFILTDIHQSAINNAIWQKLYNDATVKLSIDIYQYGILLFSDEFKEKQHFVLKNPG